MNKEYICFKNLTLVEENNGELLIREQPKNVDEVLKIENEIELLKKIISDDKDMKNKLKKRINYLKKSSDSTYRIIYGVLAIYFLVTTSIVASLICLGLGEGIFGIKKLIIKHFNKKIEGLNYKLKISNQLLKEEQQKMNELKNSKFKKDNLNNIFVTIDDEERLHRIERNLHLAYLYKIKESIIQKKIVNDSINSYLDGIVFGDEILTEEDKEVILDYARKSKTLKK